MKFVEELRREVPATIEQLDERINVTQAREFHIVNILNTINLLI